MNRLQDTEEWSMPVHRQGIKRSFYLLYSHEDRRVTKRSTDLCNRAVLETKSPEVALRKNDHPLRIRTLRNARKTYTNGFHSPGENQAAAEIHSEDVRESDREYSEETQKRWHLNLELIERSDPSFFSSVDARLSRTSETWEKGLAFKGLNASVQNCLALRRLHHIFWQPKKLYDVDSAESFRRLSNTVSQFLRLCVARNLCSKYDVYKMDVLYRAVTNLGAVKRFIDFHVENRSSRTVERKARFLQKICLVPWHEDEMERDKLQVRKYLDVIIKANMGKPGHGTAQPRSIPAMPVGKVQKCFRHAFDEIKDVMATYDSMQNTESAQVPERVQDIVEKWSQPFLTFIILCSGGQSPQAISKIEVPCPSEFEDILDRAAFYGFVELATLRGKRTMSLGVPKVKLPTFSVPFLRFQVSTIHSLVASLHNMKTSTEKSRPLLLDSDTGMAMDASKITRKFKLFVRGVCPRLSFVNLQSLRTSCLNSFLQGFREGKVLHDRSEEQFLDSLARHMNTTSMQIRKRGGVRGSQEYDAAANELVRYLA